MMEVINGEKVATNKKDGTKVVYRGGSWVPYAPTAAAPDASAPSNYQKYFAQPVTGAVAQAIGGPIFNKSVTGGPPMIGSGAVPQSIAKAVVPQTPTQAGVDAGMVAGGLLAPEVEGPALLAKLARAGIRVGGAALGGAGGAKVEGKPAAGGATSGAAQAGVGEIAAPIANLAGRYDKAALNQQDVKRIGGFMKSLGSWLPTPKSAPEFDAAFRGGAATEKIGQRLAKYETAIANRLGDKPIMQMQAPASVKGGQFATVSTRATFKDALNQIKGLNDQARYNGPDSSLRLAAYDARQQAHELTQDLGKALNKQQDGLGTRYLAARRQYAGAATLRAIFSEKDLWAADGRIDMSKLQELVQNRGAAGYRDELTRIFGRDKTDQFLDKIHRGAPPTARDVAGGGFNMGMSLHPGVGIPIPRFFGHPGAMASSVGAVPRRIPAIPPAVPALAFGQTVSDLLNRLTGGASAQ